MLLKLEVKDQFQKLTIIQLVLKLIHVSLSDFFISAHLPGAGFGSVERDLALEVVFLLVLSLFNGVQEAFGEDLDVFPVIHLVDDLLPLPVLDEAILDLLHHLVDLPLTLQMELLPQNHLQDVLDGLFHMHLDEPELLIALVLEDLPEQSDFVVIPQVAPDAIDQGAGPLYDQGLQPILLIQVGVHVLLHRFYGQSGVSALDIILYLLGVDVGNGVFQLLQGKHLLVRGHLGARRHGSLCKLLRLT